MKKSKAITLISLVITIIVLIILASVAINLSIGKNGIFNRAKETKEKYEVEQIREQVEIGILDSELQRISVNDKLTIEGALQDLVENKIFESIDKQEQLGYIEEYEVKLKYNEDNKVVIEYIQKATGVRATYTLDPVSYTNIPKVNILFKVQGKVKSVTTPKGLIVYPKNEVVGIDYEVIANGRYKFIIEKEDGSIVEKEAIVDTIDTLPPKDFEIKAEVTRTGDLIITANVEDDESETSAKSGIAKIEYYVKLTTKNNYTKYETNKIENLPSGTYNVYAICYDRAGNKKQSKNTEQVKIEEWVKIWNEEDLIGVREDVSKGIKRNYILMDDIELTKEWIPIGGSGKNFNGKFEGDNKKISNLNNGDKIKSTGYQGLFSEIDEEGKVTNLIIEGEITGNTNVGLLAGYNRGKIENVKVEGKVVGVSSIGGLVGGNYAKEPIKECSSNVIMYHLENLNEAIGGLVGKNYSTIEQCMSIVNIVAGHTWMEGGRYLGSESRKVGGLVGENRGTIKNSYSIGYVKGFVYIGGLVGDNYAGSILNSYTMSEVIGVGTTNVLTDSGTANNSYWIAKGEGIQSSSKGTEIKNLEDIKKQSTYLGFDFENVWIMKEYPELRCFQTEE